MTRRLATGFAIALALTGVAACSKKQAPAAVPPSVNVVQLAPLSVPIYDEFIGQTDAPDNVEIRARVEGYVEDIPFTEGSIVSKGALLYTLDRRPFEAALESSKASLAQAKAMLAKAQESVELVRAKANLKASNAELVNASQLLARVQPLAEQKAVTQAQLDEATARQKEAEARVAGDTAAVQQAEITQRTDIDAAKAVVAAGQASVRASELNLGYTKIYAPVSGRIGRSAVKLGSLVQQGMAEPLTIISTTGEITVNFTITERQYLDLAEKMKVIQSDPGRKGQLQLILADGSVHPEVGRVNLADRSVDPQTGTLGLRAIFPNPEGLVKPGQFAKIRAAIIQTDNAIIIPQEAIQDLLGSRYVYVVGDDNIAKRRDVVPGARIGTMWVIDKGLNPGERVVIEGLQKIRPDTPVTPTTVPLPDPNAPRANTPSAS
ncbi:MAG: efflux RND transporter periplasmic adaptor subunit [Blastocatellia bacterium]|jgi:membrane fusion protein (multidrug efflux system)|nr:efflux RND transporter periplasmic adaptor subunit [Blastocatellia bacterium]MBK6426970.1 efflux RND transporter periplasmic adaptor subunit [Blastocatellia bacterium]